MKFSRKIIWSILEIVSVLFLFGVTLCLMVFANFPIWGAILPVAVLAINLTPILFVFGVIRKTVMTEETFIGGLVLMGNFASMCFCAVLIFVMNVPFLYMLAWVLLLMYLHVLVIQEAKTGLFLGRRSNGR